MMDSRPEGSRSPHADALAEARHHVSLSQMEGWDNMPILLAKLKYAKAYAQIAQAEAAREQVEATRAQTEQLKRIADLLSIYLADYDPNGNEAQGVTTEDNGF